MEITGAGGGGGGAVGGSGDHDRKKKRHHRHTANQIQLLESTFKENPHPDEKTRLQLSRELGLAPRQIKFWFQNRRTQMKAQHERADNNGLRAENDKIRCENIAIREALKNVFCPNCGGPPVAQDSDFDEHKLRLENARLKEELARLSSIAAKYIGRPIPQLLSSLDLSMAIHGGPSLDPDLLSGIGIGPSPTMVDPNPPFDNCVHLTAMDKSFMANIATNAMDELIKLLQTDEPLWTKSLSDGMDTLNLDNYDQIFPRPNAPLKNPNLWIEASRASRVVMMNSLQLVDMFVDLTKWVELFPTIVSRARTIEVISSGMLGCQSGSLQLMYEELQVLSPLVSTRQFYVLRFCQQIEQGSWAVVDVSYDHPHVNAFSQSQFNARRLPSGCLIQGMPNGYTKVTWVEHIEIEEKTPIHKLYKDLIHGGLSFGAERWLACLQRSCERIDCLTTINASTNDLGGVIPSLEGKRSIMKLAQRMINNFCASINPCNAHTWTSFSSGSNEFEVRVTLHKSSDSGHPNGVVLGAAASIWLPISAHNVFEFFRNARNRPQWDVLSNQNPVQEVAHISNGSHPGNSISVLRACESSQNNLLILQESRTDSSESMVVYCPVDLPAINIAISGEDPSCIPVIPSGFTVTSAASHGGASTSNNGGGSIVTLMFQVLMSNSPAAKLTPETMTTVNNLIGNTVHQIKQAFDCSETS